ncbi:hypothetical protein HN592_03240 [Candidatus Woesearchaeota archaeon]|jgi:CxxC-x17-CxxC domain-containing protein|nr:hypothetical protein [Candidatus Woesearchaeota archaeon]MBT4368226.1 hypothetical protein [Candidatus Woesearchaeota archaeon]MBT4712715.1 hypothetical protein [Candidatus Woesearchaeota archaeon]MBT6639627.1 hypothetical protein [Candidatus Woesearchaeota archaeon]MBT7133799.1 hypothetical protein [Candidatus Woesearchaeota archaeon]
MARFEGPRGNNRGGRGRDFEDRGDRGNRGRSRDFEDRPRRDSSRNSSNRRDFEKTRVTCDGCGESCEVPFKPTSNKPVFCSDCFRKEGKGPGSSKGPDLSDINRKLDRIIALLEEK